MFGLANYGLVRFGLVLWTLKSLTDFNEISFIKILSVGHHIGQQFNGGPFGFGLSNYGLVRFGLALWT